MPSSAPARLTWRPDIEGLRGLAVLLVVAFHAGVPAFRGAFVAVDVFFVLSGFFLTSALTRQLVTDNGIDLTDVYGRRVWRLLPAMVVVLLATLTSVMFLYAPIDRAAIAESLQPVAFFTGNLAFAAEGVNYFSADQNPLLHTWTIGVEYQLLLFFPVLVVVLAWIGKRRSTSTMTDDERRVVMVRTVFVGVVVVGVLSFALSVVLSGNDSMWAYFGPHTRLWAFAAGAAASFLVAAGQSLLGSSRTRVAFAQGAGLLAIVLPALIYDRSMPYPGAIALVPVGGTLLLLAGGATASNTSIGRALASPALMWLGRVSYPWYLWHWPLMVLGAVVVPGLGAWGKLACALVGLALAVLTQRFVERPVNAYVWPHFAFGDAFLNGIGVSMALLLLAHWTAQRSARYVERTEHRVFAAARDDRMDHGCWARSVDTGPRGNCAFGEPTSGSTLVLLGDSHAEHWLGGLDRAGREHGWRVEANVMGGCPVSDFSALIKGAVARRYRECSRYREAMLSRIVARRPRAVVLSSFDDYMESDGRNGHEYQVDEATWTEGLRRTYSRFDQAGIQTIVIRGTPRVPFNVPRCLSRRLDRLPMAADCVYSLDRRFVARARRAQDVAARGLRVTFLDMGDQVCASARCTTMRNGMVMFTDDNHLTASFARSLGPVLGARLERALAQ